MNAPSTFWSYQAGSATPSLQDAIDARAIPPTTTDAQWFQLSPGMRSRNRPKRQQAGRVMTNKAPTLYFYNATEQNAVAWFKRTHGRRWLAYATGRTRGVHPIQGIPRATLVHWRTNPYGHAPLNRSHQWALRCICRNVYFPELARKIGKRKVTAP